MGDQTSGVGARRRVELKPIGSMDEAVTIWEEGRRIDTQNLPSAPVPFKHAESTLMLEPDAEGTLATFEYRYVPRGGPLGRLAGPLIDKMLTGTFTEPRWRLRPEPGYRAISGIVGPGPHRRHSRDRRSELFVFSHSGGPLIHRYGELVRVLPKRGR